MPDSAVHSCAPWIRIVQRNAQTPEFAAQITHDRVAVRGLKSTPNTGPLGMLS
jgi:hypothetical protein